MKASSESGECASLISMVCCVDLDVAVVPDMAVVIPSSVFQTSYEGSNFAALQAPSTSRTRNHPGLFGFGREASRTGIVWKREERKLAASGPTPRGRGFFRRGSLA